MVRIRSVAFVLWGLLIVSSGAQGVVFEDSVVILSTASQPSDVHSPWSKREPQTLLASGAILDGNLVVTTAFAIRSATSIEGRLLGRSERFALTPVLIDYEINLALLRPSDPSSLRGTTPFAMGGPLLESQEAWLLKDRDPFRLTRLPIRLNDVSILRSATSAYGALAYVCESKASGLGWAEPIVRDNRLIAIASGQDDASVYAIPAAVISRFVAEARQKTYRGFPAMGLVARTLVDPNLRGLIGASGTADGVRISQVLAFSPFAGKLQEDDVLLSIDGHRVSAYGDINWAPWGKLPLQVAMNFHWAGDAVNLDILRRGKPLKVSAIVPRFSSNRFRIAHARYDEAEPYLIFGGLIIQELSREYLQLWGKEWMENAPLELLYAGELENDPPAQAGARFLILNRILTDEFNRGYEGMDNLLIEAVNGKKVESLADLNAVLKTPVERQGKKFAVFKFRGGGGEIILGYDGLGPAQQRIAKNYGIGIGGLFFK